MTRGRDNLCNIVRADHDVDDTHRSSRSRSRCATLTDADLTGHSARAGLHPQVSLPAHDSVRERPARLHPDSLRSAIERSPAPTPLSDRSVYIASTLPRLSFCTPLGRVWAAPGPRPTRNDAKPRETMQGVEAVEIPSPVGRIGRKPYAARGGANQAEPGRIGLGNRCSIP